MKDLIKFSTVSVVVASMLIACGGSSKKDPIADSGDDQGTKTTEIAKTDTISGKAVDGYLMGSLVCLDLNLNGNCDNDAGTTNVEPFTLTGNDGSFELDILKKHKANPMYATNYDKAPLIVFGGRDSDKPQEDFKGKLKAPNDGSGSINITPVSTIVSEYLKKDGDVALNEESIKKAKETIAKKFGLTAAQVDEDPRQSNNADLIRVTQTIQKAVNTMVEVASKGESEDKSSQHAENIMAAFAAGLDNVTDGQEISAAVVQMVEKAPADKLSAVPNVEKAKDLSKANAKNVALVLKDTSGDIDTVTLSELMKKIAVLENQIEQKIAEKDIKDISTSDIKAVEFTQEELNEVKFDDLEKEMVLFDSGVETWDDSFELEKYEELDVSYKNSAANLKSKFEKFDATRSDEDKLFKDQITKITKEINEEANDKAQKEGEEKLASLEEKVKPLLTPTNVATVADAKTMFNHLRETVNTFVDVDNIDTNTPIVVGAQATLITDKIEPKLEEISNSFEASSTALGDSVDAFSNSIKSDFDAVLTSIKTRLNAIGDATEAKSSQENWEVTVGDDTLSHTYSKDANDLATESYTFNGVTTTSVFDNKERTDNKDDEFDVKSVVTSAPIVLKGTGYDLQVSSLSFLNNNASFKASGTITGANASTMQLNALDIAFDANPDEKEAKFFQKVEAKFEGKITAGTRSLEGSFVVSEANKKISLSGKYIGASDLSFEGNMNLDIDINELKDDREETDYIQTDSLVMVEFADGAKSLVLEFKEQYFSSTKNGSTYKHTLKTQDEKTVSCQSETIYNHNIQKNIFSCEGDVKVIPFNTHDKLVIATVNNEDKIIRDVWANGNGINRQVSINFVDDYAYVKNSKLMSNGKEIIISDIRTEEPKEISDAKLAMNFNGNLTHKTNIIKADVTVSKEANSNMAMIKASDISMHNSENDFVKIASLNIEIKTDDNNDDENNQDRSKFENYTIDNNNNQENNNNNNFGSISANGLEVKITDADSKSLTFDANITVKISENDDQDINFNGMYSYAGTSFEGQVEAKNNDIYDTASYGIIGKVTPAGNFQPFSISVAGSNTSLKTNANALFTRGANEEYKLAVKVDGNETHDTISLADINGVMASHVSEKSSQSSSESTDATNNSSEDMTTEHDEENESYIFTNKNKKTLATIGKEENGNSWEIKYSDNSSETIF
jgi:hypothetical protein